MIRSRAVLQRVALALCAVSVPLGCGSATDDAPGRDSGPPVLVVGLDGFEWAVALPLLRAGELPALAGLMQRGIFGELATLNPTVSPRLWTTMATGHLPAAHGILGFVIEEGERSRRYTSGDRRVKAFWNILTDAGVSNDTIGWWNTYPAEEVHGLMVAQTNTLGGPKKGALIEDMPRQVWPPSREPLVFELLKQADASLPALRRQVFGKLSANLTREQAQRVTQCDWALRADSTYVAVLSDRLEREAPARITSIYLGGTDVVGHRFWAAYDPEPFGLSADSDEVRAFAHMIPSYYRYVDRVIGELVAEFPPDTTVIIVSDHGMAPYGRALEAAANGERVHRLSGHHTDVNPGVFIAAGARIRDESSFGETFDWSPDELPTLGSMEDICPTLLALLGVPFGEDMSGRPMRNVMDAAFLESVPPTSVPTHADAAWAARRPDGLDIDEDPARLEQLKNLGYLGE